MNRLLDDWDSSKHIVVLTGAGVSTAASIPDYRGENGLQNKRTPLVVLGLAEQKTLDFTMPTYTHLALTKLIKMGKVKFIATSNHDGLHQKSGTADEFIADVFGNVYVEKCVKCKRYYKRKVIVPTLGRSCDDPSCGGRLRKTGTRMGGETPPEPLARAVEQAKKADLALVLGSSMLVSPFCNLPGMAGKMVIVSLQETPYDSEATLKLHARCDDVMRTIMRHHYLLERRTRRREGMTTVGQDEQEGVEEQEEQLSFDYIQPYSIRYTFSSSSSSSSSTSGWKVSVCGDPERPLEPPSCIEEVQVLSISSAVEEITPSSFSSPSSSSVLMEKTPIGSFSTFIRASPSSSSSSYGHLALQIKFQEALDPEGSHTAIHRITLRRKEGGETEEVEGRTGGSGSESEAVVLTFEFRKRITY